MCGGPSDYNSVLRDPDHAITGNNIQFYGTYAPDNDAIAWHRCPTSRASSRANVQVRWQGQRERAWPPGVLNYYTEERVPVLTALVKNFVTFNHWHSDVPGVSFPTRGLASGLIQLTLHSLVAHQPQPRALTSGTSGATAPTTPPSPAQPALPQRSIFQQPTETNHSWINYVDPAGRHGPRMPQFVSSPRSPLSFHPETPTYQVQLDLSPKEQRQDPPIANFYTDAAAASFRSCRTSTRRAAA